LEEWVPRVYRFALRLSADAHTAEDLTQETFLRAWRHCQRLRDERVVGVWLFRITANLWRDQMRRRRSPVARADLLTGEELGRTQPAGLLAVHRESLGRALEALAALPPRQREVMYLSACERLSTAQVAEVLGIAVSAVKANLSVARKKIREQLHDLFPDPAQFE
jgi:RNA polymerase sigma-70 factor (ECF subfamily)